MLCSYQDTVPVNFLKPDLLSHVFLQPFAVDVGL